MVGSVSQLEINKHLELGREFLVHGQLQDALSHYHAAIGKFGYCMRVHSVCVCVVRLCACLFIF